MYEESYLALACVWAAETQAFNSITAKPASRVAPDTELNWSDQAKGDGLAGYICLPSRRMTKDKMQEVTRDCPGTLASFNLD